MNNIYEVYNYCRNITNLTDGYHQDYFNGYKLTYVVHKSKFKYISASRDNKIIYSLTDDDTLYSYVDDYCLSLSLIGDKIRIHGQEYLKNAITEDNIFQLQTVFDLPIELIGVINTIKEFNGITQLISYFED